MAFSTIIAGSIAFLNMTIRFININLIDQVGYNYHSQRVRMIMQTILYTQYFNSSILLMLCTANFENTILNFFPLREQYHDTTLNWYNLFGPAVIKTMSFYAVFPYIDFLGFGTLGFLKRWWDSGFASFTLIFGKKYTKNFTTKLTTVA
mgnify:CR=1 FL=1